MSEIQKGIILTIEGKKDRNNNYTKARVQSTSADGTSTLPITIPWYLRGAMGNLKKGTEIAYALFDDSTGVVISRMDGDWEGKMEESNLVVDLQGNSASVKGSMDVSDGISGKDTDVDTLHARKITVDNSVDAGSVTAGSVTDSGIRLATHTHKDVTAGGDNTGVPNGG